MSCLLGADLSKLVIGHCFFLQRLQDSFARSLPSIVSWHSPGFSQLHSLDAIVLGIDLRKLVGMTMILFLGLDLRMFVGMTMILFLGLDLRMLVVCSSWGDGWDGCDWCATAPPNRSPSAHSEADIVVPAGQDGPCWCDNGVRFSRVDGCEWCDGNEWCGWSQLIG